MKKKLSISPFVIWLGINVVSVLLIFYITKGVNHFTFRLNTGSITGYDTSPISIAKWELGVLIFVVGAFLYNYKENDLEKKSNTEWAYVLIGIMTQGIILAIGAY